MVIWNGNFKSPISRAQRYNYDDDILCCCCSLKLLEMLLNPKTLFELCVEACAATLHAGRNLGEARLLPPTLKTRILELSIAKGLVNEDILRELVHRDTPALNLGGGVTVDDGMLMAVAASRPRLTALYLGAFWGENDTVTAAGLLGLFRAVGADLRELALHRCPAVDDAVVAEVPWCCPRLTTLDLGGCREVSDLGLVALAVGRSRGTLTHLVVDNCPAVTDSGLMVALQHCPNLACVSIEGCFISGSFADVLQAKLGGS